MLENLIVRQTKTCDCGREFIIQDIQKLERINDDKFYGGVVKHYSKARCPQCGKEVILLLKQAGQTYEVKNIAEESISNSMVKQAINNVLDEIITSSRETIEDLDGKKVENPSIEATIENNEKNNLSNKLICPECGKSFKNKAGLTNHSKTHKK